MNRSLVITSISSPSDVLKSYASESVIRNIDFILIGDTKSPNTFEIYGCDFWNIDQQKTLKFNIINLLQEQHYARKNIGYLLAMQRGADIIIETDDDNIPYENFWQLSNYQYTTYCIENNGWTNIYKYFAPHTHIWPRGFPIELIKTNFSIKKIIKKVYCPIQQGLVNNNPDVDSIYRLTSSLPITFDTTIPLALGDKTWCPFNSQNTIWFKNIFPLLYLPSFCSFRMTDIWRSFVAQRICWTNDWHVLFKSPTVYQIRNEHNQLKDFEDEIPGYLNNAKICSALELLNLPSGTKNILSNLRTCYECLINLEVMDSKELQLVDAWINDVSQL